MLADIEDADRAPLPRDRVPMMTAATPMTETMDVVLAATAAGSKNLTMAEIDASGKKGEGWWVGGLISYVSPVPTDGNLLPAVKSVSLYY